MNQLWLTLACLPRPNDADDVLDALRLPTWQVLLEANLEIVLAAATLILVGLLAEGKTPDDDRNG